MLDLPHPRANHAALFMTHLTQEPEFMGYVPIVQDITSPRLSVSMTCCYEKTKKEVKFAILCGGGVAHFSSPLEHWELLDMEGPFYRLLHR